MAQLEETKAALETATNKGMQAFAVALEVKRKRQAAAVAESERVIAELRQAIAIDDSQGKLPLELPGARKVRRRR